MINDKQMLAHFILAWESGHLLNGNYKSILNEILPEIEFNHFRAIQIGRAGKLWEDLYQIPFSNLCPDLMQFASNWEGI